MVVWLYEKKTFFDQFEVINLSLRLSKQNKNLNTNFVPFDCSKQCSFETAKFMQTKKSLLEINACFLGKIISKNIFPLIKKQSNNQYCSACI